MLGTPDLTRCRPSLVWQCLSVGRSVVVDSIREPLCLVALVMMVTVALLFGKQVPMAFSQLVGLTKTPFSVVKRQEEGKRIQQNGKTFIRSSVSFMPSSAERPLLCESR